MPKERRTHLPKTEEVEDSPIHDDVVLRALAWLAKAPGVFRVELEYEIKTQCGSPLWVDLAAFSEAGLPMHLFEVKSKREAQSASGWTRQVRQYTKLTGIPCSLVIAHDLSEVNERYLRFADVKVFDLRRIAA
jgi:hypothetical protein